ncbi:MAG: DNA cytosine methyltransferase [Ectothiorhodospiraceae bacterium]|nr:DNA cytosine methyltransferase [Ectothiorhodospiraceae bacterium]
MSKHTVVSLFSGCGGMDLGFLGGFRFLGKTYKKRDFEIIWANELNKAACATYSHNISKNIVNGDIWDVIDDLPTSADVVIGGFPCQDISVNGKRAGVDGNRSGLYRAMVETVKRVQPKIFVAENVKGLLMEYNKFSLHRVIEDFEALGYHVSYALYNSANFGVPQARERVFIIGTPIGHMEFSHPKPKITQESWVSSESAISDLELVEEDKTINHTWSRAKKSPDQGSRQLKAERPATTIRAECHGNIQFHYKLDRRISMREAARIQSFPDRFIFKSNLRETERQVGNAVPPVLAWHLAEYIKDHLLKSSNNLEEVRIAI